MLDYTRARTFGWELPWKGVTTPFHVQFVPFGSQEKTDVGRLLFTPEGDFTFWILRTCRQYPVTFDWSLPDSQIEEVLRQTLEAPVPSTYRQNEYFFDRCFELFPEDTENQWYLRLDIHLNGWDGAVLIKEQNGNFYDDVRLFLLWPPLQAEKGFIYWNQARIEDWLGQQQHDPRSEMNAARNCLKHTKKARLGARANR